MNTKIQRQFPPSQNGAAMLAPVMPDDLPGVRLRWCGLWTCPPNEERDIP